MTQPRPLIQPLTASDIPSQLQAGYARALQQAGEAMTVAVLAHSDTTSRFFFDRFYNEFFNGGAVDIRYKQMLRLVLSGLHGCRSCNLNNRASAIQAGLTSAKLDALQSQNYEALTEPDRLVCELAETLALTNPVGRLSQTHYESLRSHFSDADIVELGVTAAVLCGMAKFLFAFDLVQREDSCLL
ncbi:MAG: hypothetical protein AAGJ86_01210 [Pseudomonadota bacterium]